MLKQISNILIFFTLQTSTLDPSIIKQCEPTRCEGNYKFDNIIFTPDQVKIGEVDLDILLYPESVKIGIGRRRKLEIYCYDGTSIDPNTGCYETVKDMTPNVSTLRSWQITSKCPTGNECPPDGNCWGGDADLCWDDRETVLKGPNALKWMGSRYMLRFYHTCTKSWECYNWEISVPTSASIDNESRQYFYTTKDGEKIIINSTLYEAGLKTMDGSTHYLIDREPMTTLSKGKGKCYSTGPQNTKCIILEPDFLKGATFDSSDLKTGRIRSTIIFIKSQVLTIINETIAVGGEGAPNSQLMKMAINTQKAPTIDSLLETVNSIMLIQMQSLFNVFENENRIRKIQDIIQKIIYSVSQIDKKLLSKIMETVFETKWITPDNFQRCDCYDLEEEQKKEGVTNCGNELQFIDGHYIKGLPNDNCITLDHLPVQKVNIYGGKQLDSTTIKNLPVQESVVESNIWAELQKYRLQQLFEDHNQHNYNENSKQVFSSIRSMLPLIDYTYWFLIVSSIIAWISLVICLTSRR